MFLTKNKTSGLLHGEDIGVIKENRKNTELYNTFFASVFHQKRERAVPDITEERVGRT